MPVSSTTRAMTTVMAGEQLGAKADHEAEHGEAAIPGFGEGHEAEAGSGVSHECDGLFQ
jgi:hypothetical protein